MAALCVLQECNRGGPRSVGDICDCLIEGAWWEACRVVAIKDGKKKKGGGALEVVWGEERREVPREDARSTLRFADGRWHLCKLVGVDGEAAGSDDAEQQQQEGSPANQQHAAQAAAEAGPEADAKVPPRKKRRSSKKQASPVPAAADDSPADEAEADQPGPASATKAAAEAAAAAAAAEAVEAADALMAAAASQPPTNTGRVKGRKAGAAAGAAPAKKTPARAASAPYEVPADFDASVLPVADTSTVGRAKSSLPLAFARRFLALRQGVPAEGEPGGEV